MLVGIIGAPNKGKSTLFSAITNAQVPIANYPFTTINPNKGVGYVTHECPEVRLNIKCNARNNLCIGGVRKIPFNIIDVAGLVQGASKGKGMGNQFLNDLSAADAFILVVDMSGKTNSNGQEDINAHPVQDYQMVHTELTLWLFDIIQKHMGGISRLPNAIDGLCDILSGFKIQKYQIEKVFSTLNLQKERPKWSQEQIMQLSSSLLEVSKPIVVAANKMDAPGAKERLENLKKELPNVEIFPCSAAIELALSKAASSKLINYVSGANAFNINPDVDPARKEALLFMQKFIKEQNGSGVQELMNAIIFNVLKYIAVYPVEDENKFTDGSGHVLPDAVLLPLGANALELARTIHTDIAERMLYAIDAQKKIRISKEQQLTDNQIVKIVSAVKKN